MPTQGEERPEDVLVAWSRPPRNGHSPQHDDDNNGDSGALFQLLRLGAGDMCLAVAPAADNG